MQEYKASEMKNMGLEPEPEKYLGFLELIPKWLYGNRKGSYIREKVVTKITVGKGLFESGTTSFEQIVQREIRNFGFAR